MPDERQPIEDVTPSTEDWGIFKDSVVTVPFHLTPLRRETSRGDLMCIGFLEDTRIEVIFPGRRRRSAAALEKELDIFLQEERKAALSRGQAAPHAVTLRFPLYAEGIWRVRLNEDEEDEFARVYQFVAARWSYYNHLGEDQNMGESPIRRPITRMPAFY